MSVGSVKSANGGFTVTDASGKVQTVDLGTLMMMLNLNRTENLDKQIAMQLDDMQKRNDKIKNLTEFLAAVRTLKANGTDDGSPTTGIAHETGSLTINGTTHNIQGPNSWCQQFGLTWADVAGDRPSADAARKTWDATYDGNISNIKDMIDGLNNDSQMDNIKLQNLLEKRTNAFEMATKTMDTNDKSIQATINSL